MVLDIIKRRPVLLTKEILEHIPTIPDRLAEPLELEKIPLSDGQPGKELVFRVVYSDLDMNHHVNNINYLKWVLDEFDLDFRNKYRISTIETNYLGEALYGDTLARDTKAITGTEYMTKIINKDTGRTILASRTKWLPKN